MRALLLPLLLGAALPAPEDVGVTAQPAPVVTPADPADPAAILLAFNDLGNRMTVPVQISGAGPYRFLIDTGAQRTVISRELAGSLGLSKGRDVRLTAMSGTSTEGTVVIPSLRVGTLGEHRIEAPALAGANLGALGLLGIDTLQGHKVTIDFDAKTMAVTPSDKRRRRGNEAQPGEIVVRARNMFGQLVVTDAWCDGQRVKVVLDTGSVVSLGNLPLKRRFDRRRKRADPITLISVTGGAMAAQYTQLDHVRIGELSINALPMAYADAAPFKQFGLENTPAILLGMDALQLFRRVEIDFANREVRLLLPRNYQHDIRNDGWKSARFG